MNVVLVTHDSPFGRYLAGELHASGHVDRVVIERGRARWRFYWRKLGRVGSVDFVFQVLLNRWFRREGGRNLSIRPLPPHRRIASIDGCDFAADDLVIGFGTSYVSPRTLTRVRQGILNLHTGLLPYYRGVKSEFWTLYHGDHARVGWTLHYMTPRLDEGDIVLQRRIAWQGENPAQLRAALLRDAVPALAQMIDRVRSEGRSAIVRTPQGEGRYFTTPTWREWRRFRETRARELPPSR